MKRLLIAAFVLTALAHTMEQVKHPREGKPCVADTECNSPWESCSSEDNVCVHKSLWQLTGLEWFGIPFTALWLMACNSGGIGGGSTLVPLVRMLFKFDVVYAIALSNAMVTTTGLMRYV